MNKSIPYLPFPPYVLADLARGGQRRGFGYYLSVSSDVSLNILRPLFGKEGIGEILRIIKTTIFFQEYPVHLRISHVGT
ncbi:MAG TPA: hypothetical protein VJZ24_01180 [Thermodesulfovibrionales bacterium]|nr:hypothetical protein [Thermodesulfovibrionales bacterium]